MTNGDNFHTVQAEFCFQVLLILSTMSSIFRFVPETLPPSQEAIQEFLNILSGVKHLTVLTGAGISTESGIPDYRSPKVGQYARTDHRPIFHQEFMRSIGARRRYWSRNYVAWPRFSASQPNETHKKIAEWEKSPRFKWLITQNVDGLHSRAGSRKLTELHGCALRVRCMNCNEIYDRKTVQDWIDADNK